MEEYHSWSQYCNRFKRTASRLDCFFCSRNQSGNTRQWVLVACHSVIYWHGSFFCWQEIVSVLSTTTAVFCLWSGCNLVTVLILTILSTFLFIQWVDNGWQTYMNAQQRRIAFYNNIIIVKEVMWEFVLKLVEMLFQNKVFHVFSSIADTFLITALQHSGCKSNMGCRISRFNNQYFSFQSELE